MAKGNTLVAESVLQFYPTHEIETRRILGVLCNYISLKRHAEHDFNTVYGDENRHKLYEEMAQLDFKVGFSEYRYEKLLQEERLDLIDKFFELNLSYNQGVVVSDLFCGEGSWLKLFKKLSNGNILIGNEIEHNRYNNMISDNLIDYHYNLPFEDLQLPKKIINVMLFNPPYGNSNSERNVRRYLRMILEKDLMCDNGVFVFVIRTEDALDCADLITQHFNIDKCLIYKTHEKEFTKWQQIVIFAELRDKKLDLNNINDVAKYKEYKDQFIAYVNTQLDFFISDYSKFKYHSWKIPNIKKAFENFNYINSDKKYISNKNDKAWKWILKDATITDLSEEIINIPKNLKSGELANIISSGKINGELELENGTAHHIAVGGVKKEKTERVVKQTDKKTGVEVDKKETTIQSLPYLNLLINNNGKLQIKELKAKGDVVDNDTLLED